MEDVIQWSVGAGFVSLFDMNRQDMHQYILNLVPCFPPSARLQGVVVQHKAPIKGQMSSSKTRPSKYTFLMVASKKGRQKLYIKQKLQDRGIGGGEKKKKGRKGNGGWTDLWRKKKVKLNDTLLYPTTK